MIASEALRSFRHARRNGHSFSDSLQYAHNPSSWLMGERETSMPLPDARPPDPPPAYMGTDKRRIDYLEIRMSVAVSFLAQSELYDKFVEHVAWLDDWYRRGDAQEQRDVIDYSMIDKSGLLPWQIASLERQVWWLNQQPRQVPLVVEVRYDSDGRILTPKEAGA